MQFRQKTSKFGNGRGVLVAMPDFLRPSIPFIQQGVFLQVDIEIDGTASG